MKNTIYLLAEKYYFLCALMKHMDGTAALALRVYLVPIFWMADTRKLEHFQETVA